jgi:glycosyltransferase involved in cell wall biosynthesis
MKNQKLKIKNQNNNLKFKNDRNRISVVIVARNEEKMIGECIESVVGWANEVLVVDNASIDKTGKIAKKFGAKVVYEPWTEFNYSQSRNRGLAEAKGDWILYLDADERCTKELRNEIDIEINESNHRANSSISNLKSQIFSAYAIPRRNFVLGKEFKHCGQWPDYVKRLYRKDKFKGWTGKVHEEPHFEGVLGLLKNPMIHKKHETLTEMVEKTNGWSEVEAKMMYDANHPPMNIPRFASAMSREFWLRMVKQAAFLDGAEGIIYALYQVFSRFISYAKLWEMQLNDSNRLKTDLNK